MFHKSDFILLDSDDFETPRMAMYFYSDKRIQKIKEHLRKFRIYLLT